MDINKILDEARRLGCSDLHFTAGLPPVVRLHGSIKKLSGYPDCTEPIIVNIINQITSMKHKASIQKGLDTDFSYVSASGTQTQSKRVQTEGLSRNSNATSA